MTVTALSSSAGSLWTPPLPAARYRCAHELLSEERAAIALYFEHRSQPGRRSGLGDLREAHPLAPLLQPVRDALDLMGSTRRDRNATQAVLLRECLDAGTTFWAWNRDHWLDVLGRHSRAFRARNQGRVSQSVRIEIAAIAYLHGWFRDILALGHFQRDTLARRVFGDDAIDAAVLRVVEPLKQWGYETGTAHLSCLGEALLRNESPHLEHLTAERLDRFRRDAVAGKRSLYFQLAKALAVDGILAAPLPVAHPIEARADALIAEGVATPWADWIERWHRTSSLESRDHLRLHLYKLGRWLGVHHPEIHSPEQRTRDLCAEYVAAACRMRVGDYTVRRVDFPRAGQRLTPRSMAAELVAARTFFWDCQEWGWIPRRFDPGRSLALPRSIKGQIGRKPRVIADDVWARLLWAGLHLTENDLPRAGRDGLQGAAYPIEYVRALALVWLFAGLRSDEIGRLRVGCVRWQPPAADDDDTRPVCLIDVPVHKTGVDFTKPVEPEVGKAIEAWEAVRPKQPQHVDRKTGETVNLLFVHRARPMRREIINGSIIPTLCRKAHVPTQDVRGRITSHRARATIASQLFNSREPMSLFELQAWLGHNSPASTQHYVAITPTKLAKAYADAGYFERNLRAIEVLIDQDTLKQAAAAGEPWRFYDLGHGLCAYEFFDQCAHRMACARCDFYRPRESSVVQLLDAKSNILRLLQEIPLTDDEKAVIDGDLVAIDRLTAKLADHPTPSGQTPTQLHRCGAALCSRGLTRDST
ncbi:MAG: tyrosine-type recombinase/integrase [Candidatus Wallbacteria bacterium]|nr:tyrosine-type recombinase/integrase [Candidatus Wallbacteria bacterium]